MWHYGALGSSFHHALRLACVFTGGADVLFVELIFKQQWSEKLNLLQMSQNIYVIVQNIYCFALTSLSISLSCSVSGLVCCVSQLVRFRSWLRGSRYQSVLYQKPKWCLKIEILYNIAFIPLAECLPVCPGLFKRHFSAFCYQRYHRL